MLEIFKNKRVRSVIFVSALMQGYELSIEGYMTRHLLATFPTTVLPFFNFVRALLISIFIVVGYVLIKRHATRFSIQAIVANMIVIPASYLLIELGFNWSILLGCILLAATLGTFFFIFVATMSLIFNIREHRKVTGQMTSASALSNIIFAGAIWLLVGTLSSDTLLILAEACCALILVLGWSILPQTSTFQTNPKDTITQVKAPFYAAFLAYQLVLTVITIIIGYLFFVYLKNNFANEDIAIAATVYTSLFGILIVLFELFFQDRFFNFFGITGVFFAFPVFIVCVCATSLIFPAIPLIVLVALVTSTSSLPLNMAKATLVSTAPRRQQVSLRIKITFVAVLVGEAIVGSLIVYLLGEGPFAIRNLNLVIIALATLSILIALAIEKGFQAGLKTQVEQQRYFFFRPNLAKGEFGGAPLRDLAADAKYTALKVLKRGIKEPMRGRLYDALKSESQLAIMLREAHASEQREHMQLELKSRYTKSLERFLYLFAAMNINTRAILNTIPKITEQTFAEWDESEKAKALEYLDALSDNAALRKLLKDTLELTHSTFKVSFANDPWLSRASLVDAFTPTQSMTIDQRIFFLRRVGLFSTISAEGLELIAESLQEYTVPAGDVIFDRTEEAKHVLMVVLGEVEILGKPTTNIAQYGLFGELAFLDNKPRAATAMAKTDVVLLGLDRSAFNRLLAEVPELPKAVIRQLMGYMRLILKP